MPIFRRQNRERSKDVVQTNPLSIQPMAMREEIPSNAQASGRPVLTDPLDLSQAVPELPAISIEDPSNIKLVREVERDLLMGEKYLELLLLQRLLQASSCADRREELLGNLETAKTYFAYDTCYETLRGQPVRRFDHDPAEQNIGNKSYTLTVLGWTGAIVRRGTSTEKKILRDNLHSCTQLSLVVAPSLGSSSVLHANRPESSAPEGEHHQKQSLAETATDVAGGVALGEHGVLRREPTPVPIIVHSEVPQTANPAAEPIGRFTSALWEHATGVGSVPVYVETTISFFPPQFEVAVSFQDRFATGRAKSKKTAKHIASKAMCDMLQLQVS